MFLSLTVQMYFAIIFLIIKIILPFNIRMVSQLYTWGQLFSRCSPPVPMRTGCSNRLLRLAGSSCAPRLRLKVRWVWRSTTLPPYVNRIYAVNWNKKQEFYSESLYKEVVFFQSCQKKSVTTNGFNSFFLYKKFCLVAD